MAIGPDEFRAVLGRFASGVTVLTAQVDKQDHGMTVSAFCSASLECRAIAHYAAGDHTIHVGEVEHSHTRQGRPLLYYRGGYAQIER